MTKRNESKPAGSHRDRSQRTKKLNWNRRLTMEGLEKRELLAVGVALPTINMPTFTAPRNVGTVQAFTVIEREFVGQSGLNDSFLTAQLVPLGTAPGQQNTIDITGTMGITAFPNDPLSFGTDIDVYAFDLRAGDILDIAVLGTAGTIDVAYSNGRQWFGTDVTQAFFYPADSPLQTVGNIAAAQVVPEDGRYFLTVSPIDTTTNYQIGLRTYRPIVEQLPIGAQQFIFLDFDGAIYPRNVFTDLTGVPQSGVVRIPSLQDSLPILGISELDEAGLNRLIDLTVAEVERQFAFVGTNGNAGDFDRTGVAGDYGVTILNSRDHLDPGIHPLVTRVLVGGTAANAGQPGGLYGISSTIDVGNFSMDDIVLAVLDQAAADANSVQISPTTSVLQAAADLLALTISHEAGHSFGLRHTERNPFPQNNRVSIIDGGVDVPQDLGIGPDLIYGTLDDINVDFIDDRYDAAEGYIGFARVLDGLANTLVTGTVGGRITGRVFRDANRDGSGAADVGLGGVTVFADVNRNGRPDPSEPSDTSEANGSFELSVGPGSVNVISVAPTGFVATTPGSVSTTVALGGTVSGVSFGFGQVVPNISGTVFADTNGNSFRDADEGGVAEVYVYLDLDGDNRPDLGEPGANTGADGSYTLNFPGPGTYTIRDVVPPGFEQTFPTSGEHQVVFNGIALTDNFNFGLLPSQDFGDAPSSYGTTVAGDGARHGIAAGLNLGATVDREVDGLPTTSANGDDNDGTDDEDGVRLLSPLGPGATATFEVTATNTTAAPAFVQGFIDLNRDGSFSGSGERFVTNLLVPAGTVARRFQVPVSIPAGTTPGNAFVRFRLSQTDNLGPIGFAATGEVEDHVFPILDAAEIANDDEFTVSRNSLSNQLPLLANDFQTIDNPLRIDSLNTTGTAGVVVRAANQQSVFYTPPNGFIGRDVFSYTVVDQFGNRSTAGVVVNVNFQSNVPFAIDDTFEVPQGSVNRALNVLDNDVPSIFGGLSITSVTSGSAGGTLSIVGGGQSLRYTPFPGFSGTEQFSYSVQDSVGSTSTAQVTVNLLPGSRGDDVVDFQIGLFDAVNINTPITSVQVGDEFLVRVTVEDLRLFANPEGVASAFLDLLYSDALVATLNTDNNPDFPFDISFGPLFSGVNVFQQGSSQTPGLIDDVGGVQPIDRQQSHNGPTELFTLRMQAVSPGVSVFQADPADQAISETVVLTSDVALTPSQLRLGRAELQILPESDIFTAAIDDSFPDGLDSSGNPISNTSASRNRLDVLDNDNFGPSGTVREFGLVTAPTLGNVFIDNNGTPNNLNDDFLSYRANANVNGLERFTYLIVTDDNVRSTAEVTITLGNQNANAQVAFDFNLVDSSGTPISSAAVGDRIGVQIIAEDLRSFGTSVFAGFLDVMYNTAVLRPSNTNLSDSFDFDVLFGPGFLSDPDITATAIRPGVIDEFGTLFSIPTSIGPDPALLATLFFDVVGPGTATVVGGPADSSPFTDTLLFQLDEPVDISRIRYDRMSFNVSGGAPRQNALLRQDVDNDGRVTPIDALLVINEMSRELLEGEQVSARSGLASSYYTDVNGDFTTSALDALNVINYLRRAENLQLLGESIAVHPAASSPATGSSYADQVFAELEATPAKLVSAGVSTSSAGGGVDVIDPAADDDGDDDVLDLLADDIAGLWS